MNPPCYKCPNKGCGNHDHCEAYLKFKEKRMELRKIRQNEFYSRPPHRKEM